MNQKKAKELVLLLGVFLCFDIGDTIHHFNSAQYTNTLATRVTNLKSSIAHQSHKYHHPVIHKNIPSAYKYMLMDGKHVSKIENNLIHQAKVEKRNPNSQPKNQNKINYLKGTVSTGTDNQFIMFPWTSHLNDSVRLIPGAGDSNGNYKCAFIVTTPTGKIDEVYSAVYEPSLHYFTHLAPLGTDTYTSISKMLSNKGNKKNNGKKHVNTKLNHKQSSKQSLAKQIAKNIK